MFARLKNNYSSSSSYCSYSWALDFSDGSHFLDNRPASANAAAPHVKTGKKPPFFCCVRENCPVARVLRPVTFLFDLFENAFLA